MKGFILAAGLGSRLKPWTDRHPKALVPVGGVPMLQRVIQKMQASGINDITVNCHHFSEQIEEFLAKNFSSVRVIVEKDEPLETGGAILNAGYLWKGEEPILVHNADILSNADFRFLERSHKNSGATATLLVSDRESSRKLVFDREMRLKGWHSITTDEYRPASFSPEKENTELAFSGIYVISNKLPLEMKERGWTGKFSITDYLLSTLDAGYRGVIQKGLELIDIGKPDSLNRAQKFFD